jgi:nucleotide-binding universal stress UspA family protein
MFERVLLCYDGSAAGRRTLKRGAELAMLVKASVYLLSVVPQALSDSMAVARAMTQTFIDDEELEYRKLLDEGIELLRERGVKAEGYLAKGNPIDVIVSHAKRLSIDLIVIGHYPKPSGGRWWFSSERDLLGERVNCCILVAVNAGNPRGSVNNSG